MASEKEEMPINKTAADEPETEVPQKPPKKKKLTKSEKKALKLQRQIDFKKQEIRNHLKVELELSRRTAAKLKLEWDDICKEIKLQEMREELSIWIEKAHFAFIEKDNQIQFQLDFLEEIEGMQQRAYRQQLDLFQYILDIYEALVDGAKRIYEDEAKDYLIDFEKMLGERRAVEASNLEVLEKVMYGTNFYCENELREDHKIFVENRNSLVNDEIEKRCVLRDAIVRRMKDMRRQLVEFLNEIKSDRSDPQKFEHFERLLERQSAFEIRTKRLSSIEARCTREYGDLQRELLHAEMAAQIRANEIMTEYNYFLEVRKAIERKIDLDREITYDKMKRMSNEGYFVIKNLKKIRDHGELLLSMCATALKYKTQAEKTVAWGNLQPLPPLDPEECKKYYEGLKRMNIIQLDMTKHIDISDEEILYEANMMHHFWRRHGMLVIQIAKMEEEKTKLLAEREKYICFIKSLGSSIDHAHIMKSLNITHVPFKTNQCPDEVSDY